MFFALLEVHGQVNLVPNPSFEEKTGCPQGYPDLDGVCNDWNSSGGTSDYLNNCNPQVGSNNQNGFQLPNSGEAYIGIITYMTINGPSGPNAREFVVAELLEPLVIGQNYFCSMFISYSGYGYPYQRIASNKIGMNFSTVQFNSTNVPELSNSSVLSLENIITDTVNWYKVVGSFTADSAYKYILLGNFFDYLNTDTLNLGGTPFGSAGTYYYIDDICVSSDSLYNENWTLNNSEILKDNFKIFPNPASGSINIESKNTVTQISLCNINGQLVFLDKNFKSSTISTESFESGIYFLTIESASTSHKSKIVIRN